MVSRRHVTAFVRVSIGVALLSVLFYNIDFQQLEEVLTEVDLYWLLGVLVFPHIAIFVSVMKWDWLLKAQGLHYPIGTLLRLYLIGTFFNNFLPSMVGGDVVRGYLLGADRQNTPHVTAAIVVERLSGLAALIALLFLALFDRQLQQQFPLVVGILTLVVLGSCISSFFIFRRAKLPLGSLTALLPVPDKVLEFLKRTRKQLGDYRNHKVTLTNCLLISFPFYFLAVLAVFSAGRSVGVDIDLWALMIVVPVVLFIGLMPISINGLGVNEMGWVVFLGIYGVSPAVSLAIGCVTSGTSTVDLGRWRSSVRNIEKANQAQGSRCNRRSMTANYPVQMS